MDRCQPCSPSAAVRLPATLRPPARPPCRRLADAPPPPPAEGREPIPNPPATLNVRSFGARGDGTTDDTAALQAAVKAANAGPTGGVILLPAGTYVLNRPLTVLRGGVVLRGEGQGRTVIHIPRSLSDVFSGTWSAGADGALREAEGECAALQGSSSSSSSSSSRCAVGASTCGSRLTSRPA